MPKYALLNYTAFPARLFVVKMSLNTLALCTGCLQPWTSSRFRTCDACRSRARRRNHIGRQDRPQSLPHVRYDHLSVPASGGTEWSILWILGSPWLTLLPRKHVGWSWPSYRWSQYSEHHSAYDSGDGFSLQRLPSTVDLFSIWVHYERR